MGGDRVKRPESVFSPRRSQRVPVGLEPATFGAKVWRSTRSTIGSVISGQKGEGATKLARPPFFQKKTNSPIKERNKEAGGVMMTERAGCRFEI